MNQKIIQITSLEKLPEVAQALLDFCGTTQKLALTGEIGAGKTTLVKAIGQLLQLEDMVNSPTFSIINSYKGQSATPIYHIDLYRLNNLQEAIDIGIEDYLYDEGWCFVEWPALVESILPLNIVHVSIELDEDGGRTFTFKIPFKTI